MKMSIILELTKRAKQDPAFFHALVFDPNKVMDEIKNELGEAAALSIQKINPSSIIAATLGLLEDVCGPDTTSSGPCGETCGGRTCDVTCTSASCGNTCGDSCGYTTNIFRSC